MSLTNDQRNRLREHPHVTKVYMSVMRPATVVCDTITGGPSRGDRTITLSGAPSEGALANAVVGQTVLVGSSCGDDSISRRRLKDFNAGANTIEVDENGVDWSNGDTITIVNNFELWPIFPRILTESPWTFYKDYDVTYTDQNVNIPPVAVLGPHRAAFLEDGSVTLDLDGSESYAVANGAAISSYSWSCTGGVIANAAVGSTTITFNNPGTYWLSVTVTDDNGESHTGRRVVFIHERTGTSAPYNEVEISNITGDWHSGGWATTITVRGDASQDDFPDGSLVVIWQESWYSGTKEVVAQKQVAGKDLGDNGLFVGYIRGDTTQQDWDMGTVTFDAMTIEGILKNTPMSSVGLQIPMVPLEVEGSEESRILTRDPEEWYEFKYNSLTVARAIHHLWHWHSTLLDICDVYLPVDNTLLMAGVEDFVEGNLYGQADGFGFECGIFAHVVCNKRGQIYVQTDVHMLDDDDRRTVANGGVVPEIWNGGLQREQVDSDHQADQRGEIEIVRTFYRTVAGVQLSGFSLHSLTYAAIVSIAPGEAPESEGSYQNAFERQVLDDQDQCNVLAGRAFARENNPFKDIRIPFAGNYSCLDIVPREWLEISLAVGDTRRGFVWSDERITPRNIAITYDPATGVLMTEAVFEKNADGPPGVPGHYPTEPPGDPDDPESPAWPPDNYLLSGAAISWDTTNGVYGRLAGGTDWVAKNCSIGAPAAETGGQDPFWHIVRL